MFLGITNTIAVAVLRDVVADDPTYPKSTNPAAQIVLILFASHVDNFKEFLDAWNASVVEEVDRLAIPMAVMADKASRTNLNWGYSAVLSAPFWGEIFANFAGTDKYVLDLTSNLAVKMVACFRAGVKYRVIEIHNNFTSIDSIKAEFATLVAETHDVDQIAKFIRQQSGSDVGTVSRRLGPSNRAPIVMSSEISSINSSSSSSDSNSESSSSSVSEKKSKRRRSKSKHKESSSKRDKKADKKKRKEKKKNVKSSTKKNPKKRSRDDGEEDTFEGSPKPTPQMSTQFMF